MRYNSLSLKGWPHLNLKQAFYKFFVSPDDLANKLVSAVKLNDEEKVYTLIKAGAPLNTVTIQDSTPLTQAAWGDNEELVAMLLKAGANPDFRDKQGRSPMVCAITSFNLRDKTTEKAEDHAAPAILRRLLEAGADVNARDENKTKTIRDCIRESPDGVLEGVYTAWEAAHKAAEEERRNRPPKVDLAADVKVRRPLSFRFKK